MFEIRAVVGRGGDLSAASPIPAPQRDEVSLGWVDLRGDLSGIPMYDAGCGIRVETGSGALWRSVTETGVDTVLGIRRGSVIN
ncbi:MAG: hypothetical protein AAGA32_13750 [Pseudomonadota bacterium]